MMAICGAQGKNPKTMYERTNPNNGFFFSKYFNFKNNHHDLIEMQLKPIYTKNIMVLPPKF